MYDSSNPYARPNAYDTADILAGYQKTAQEAELGKLKLDETKRVLNEEALARQIKAEAVKGLQANQGQPQEAPQAPVGMAPQVMPQPQAVPGSTEFWQGKTSAAPEQAPVKTPIQQWKASQQELNLYDQQVQEYSTIAKALNDKGLVDQAEAYTAKAVAAKEKGAKANEDFLKHSHTVLGYAGQLADGYLDFVKAHPDDPGAQNAAWQRMIMDATSVLGADQANKLSQIPPEMRQQAAEQYGNQAKTGAERTRLAIENQREAGKAERAVKKEAFDRDVLAAKNTHQAWLREFGERKLNVQQDQFAYKALEGNLTKEITTVENRNKSLDADINRLNQSLENIKQGKEFVSAYGKPITSSDPSIIEKEAGILNDALAAKIAEKQENADYIVQLNGKRRDLTKFVPKSVKREGGTATTQEAGAPSSEAPVTPSATAASAISYDTLSPTEKNWVDTNADYNHDMSIEQVIAEGVKSGNISSQKTKTTAPAATTEAKPTTTTKREQQLKELLANKPTRADFTDQPEGAGQFLNAITNWNKKYQALANPTIGQRVSETYDDWFKTQTPEVVKDKEGNIISEEPGLENSHPELLLIGGGKGAQVLATKFGKPVMNKLGSILPKFAEKVGTPEYAQVLERAAARYQSAEGYNVLQGSKAASKITPAELSSEKFLTILKAEAEKAGLPMRTQAEIDALRKELLYKARYNKAAQWTD